MLKLVAGAILALMATDIASLIWVGGKVGVAATLLLLGCGIVAGAVAWRSAGAGLLRTLQRPTKGDRGGLSSAVKGIAQASAGVLLLAPGFASDLLALLVLLPAVQRWVSSFLASRASIGAWTSAYDAGSRGNLIESEAIDLTPRDMPPSDGAPR
jgi:UPF0716 protein FxsA